MTSNEAINHISPIAGSSRQVDPEGTAVDVVTHHDGVILDVQASEDDFSESESEDESQPDDLPPDEPARPLVEAAEGSGFTPTISREQIAHLKNDPEFKQMMFEMFAENF